MKIKIAAKSERWEKRFQDFGKKRLYFNKIGTKKIKSTTQLCTFIRNIMADFKESLSKVLSVKGNR